MTRASVTLGAFGRAATTGEGPMRWLKPLLLALLFSLLVGIAIGTALRLRLECATVYMGSATRALPLDVGFAGPAVLDPGHHEEQVG